MFVTLLEIESRKLFKRWILWIELGLLALMMPVLYVLLYTTTQLGTTAGLTGEAADAIAQNLTWPGGLVGSIDFASGAGLGGVMIIILVGAVTAQEYTWRTMQLWLSRGVSRPALLAAKFASFLLPALMTVLTPLLVGGLVTAVFSQQLLGTIPFDQVEWGRIGSRLVLTAYTLLPYAALTFLLAVASRSTVVAIGGGLAYALLLEGIAVQLLSFAGGTLARIGQYLPAGLSQSLLTTSAGLSVQVGGQNVGSDLFLSPEASALGIGLYAVLLLALALWLFRRQDLAA